METTQDRIVTTARKLFAENGYRGTTTAELARCAGVAEGTIYRYFKDKKDLFVACVEPAIREVVRRETAVGVTGTPRQRLRERLIERMRVVREHMDVFAILLTESRQHPEILQLLVSQALESVPPEDLQLLQAAMENGVLKRPPNPLILNVGLTAAMWAMLFMGPMAEQLFAGWPAPVRLDRLEEDLADFVCDALLGPEVPQISPTLAME